MKTRSESAGRKAWTKSIRLAIQEGNAEIIQDIVYPKWWTAKDERRRLQAIKTIMGRERQPALFS